MKKKILFVLVAFLPFLIITSCKREMDPIFEENATHRMNERIDEIYAVLEGNPNGWLIKYYPHASYTYGGFTLFAKFTGKTTVQLTSDINEDIIISSYKLRHGAGPVLTFNTYNKVIHFFSEPGADSGVGAGDLGMGGDFEFLVLEYTKDKVVLKGNKSGNEYEMYPLAAGEFETLSTDYQEESELFSEFDGFKFQFENTSGEISDMGSSYRTFQELTEGDNPLMPFRIVPGGLEFFQTYTLDGVSFDNLYFHAASAEYTYGYYADKDNKIKIYPVIPLSYWFVNNLWSTSYSNLGPPGKAAWDIVRTGMVSANLTLSNFYIGYWSASIGSGAFFMLNNWASVGFEEYAITPLPGTTDEISFSYQGTYSLGGFTGAQYGVIQDLTLPIYQRSFKITTEEDTDKPSSVLLTDKTNASNTIRLVLEDIDDPMNN